MTDLSPDPQQPAPGVMPPARSARYRIERLLGEGAFGRTWLATDLVRGEAVAFKELLPSRWKTLKDLELFEREASTLQSLDHPGIPRYIDHFEEAQGEQLRYVLVQEFVDGHELGQEVQGAPLEEAQVIAVAEAVLDILCYLHALRPPVVHRDIKPSNIMRRRDGRLVLIDFGAVREVLDQRDAEGGTMVGTFGYMPPEQYAGDAWPQSDLFALGATCVHLLTGRSPEHFFTKLFHIELPRTLRVSLGFRLWLDRLLAPERERRFSDAGEALRALRRGFLFHAVERRTHLLPPDPGPAPRRSPGLHYRHPMTGGSVILSLVRGAVASLLALPAVVASVVYERWDVLVLTLFVQVSVLAAFAAHAYKTQRLLERYRSGIHVVGEVTGVYATGGLQYRYLAGETLCEGSLRTSAKQLRTLRAGDPVAVLYDESAPERSQPFLG